MPNDMPNKKDNKNAQEKEKNSRFSKLLRDQRVIMAISFVLAVVVWLTLSVINGEEQEKTITNVPVNGDFSGTVAEELGFEAFWSGPLTDPNELTVTVVVKCKRYENITADTLNAELVASSVYAAGEHTLPIRVSAKRTTDKDRFTVVSVSPNSVPLYFDQPKSLEFELTPSVTGDIKVPEGYHAEDVILSQKSVSISGPARLVEAVTAVKAVVPADDLYSETTVFQNIEIVPVDRYGNTSPYLTVDDGNPEISATLRIWKKTKIIPSVDFQNVPGAYLSKSLPVTLSPASANAALPEDSIALDQRYSVGVINYHELSPANNKFVFLAEDLKEIRLFDDIDRFTATVDMEGYDTVKLNLPMAQIKMQNNEAFSARFQELKGITVVGPADVVAELTDEDLIGTVELPEDAAAGQARLPVNISVSSHEDCWVYGEYTVQTTLTAIQE